MTPNDKITTIIKSKVKEVALVLMRHENKDSCLAGISILDWRLVHYKQKFFVIIPSPAFRRFILNREYPQIVSKYPNSFGTNNDWDVLNAIHVYEKHALIRNYTDQEYLDYLQGETMAYVFDIIDEENVSDKILRLDICRGIYSNKFRGGILHALKHFTIEGYSTLSSNNHKEYEFETWSQIYLNIIINFFSTSFYKENKDNANKYIGESILNDSRTLRGVYFKEDNVPVYFLDSIRVDSN
jgi:hypothetical protein